jgi:hypothetical protein
MIDAVLFDKLVCLLRQVGQNQIMNCDSLYGQEEIARIIRRNDETFGGIQVSAVLTCTLHISLFWKLI